MSSKNYDYFEKFTLQMAHSKKAAQQLLEMLENYTEVNRQADMIHDTEHDADKLLREIMNELNRSFITPIDREDIVNLCRELDDITDSIEDVANLFEMLSITEVRIEALAMANMILDGCNSLYDAITEFANFKNSRKLKELTMKVNEVEREGDTMHRDVIKMMYLTEKDAITLMKWKEIFDAMENVLDDCEDVADLLDGLAIKNS